MTAERTRAYWRERYLAQAEAEERRTEAVMAAADRWADAYQERWEAAEVDPRREADATLDLYAAVRGQERAP